MKRFLSVVLFSVVAATAVYGVEFKLVEQGIEMDGRYYLSFPLLTDSAEQVTKPMEIRIAGHTATMSYPSGVRLELKRDGAAITLHFSGLTDAVKGFRMEMTLPGEFKDGGRFQLQDEPVKRFPTQYDNEQFLLRGSPKPLALTAPNGTTFTIAMPYGWHQIQDGRAWNSPNFDYMFTTAMPGSNGEAWFTFKLWSGGLDKAPAEPEPTKPAPAKMGMRLTQDGLAIEAGSAGHFTLTHPVLVGERWDQIRKPIERKVSGHTATIHYEGDARLEVVFQPGSGLLTFTPHHIPADVKSFRSEMLIDFSYVNGGRWKIGDDEEKPFPAEKPEKPFLYQGNADRITLRHAAGTTLKLELPPHSYQQLTDNREWGWKIFAWQFSAPRTEEAVPYKVKVTLQAPDAGARKLVDRFGQNATADFPGKVTTETDLKQDVKTEAAWLASLQPPERDIYGGLPGSGAKLGLQKTGFFHVEKKQERWFLVDPDGNACFHLGICGFNPSDDYTYIKGREDIYEWLPPREDVFASAWHPNAYWNPDVLSFHLVNLIRKTGQPYTPSDYAARMIERARKWGFNAIGAFSSTDAATQKRLRFPRVASLPLSQWEGFPEIPGTHGGIWDPFDDKLRALCAKSFAEKIAPQADDPLLVGYFLVNEPLYEEIPAAVAALDASHACKRRLARMLEEKYKTIEAFNRAWETSLGSFTDVAARGLPLKSAAAREDMQAFTELFLETYFQLVTDTFRKYDARHLLLGNRLQPGTIKNESLCRISGKYMDILSFNYYTDAIDRDLLDRIYRWSGGRPIMLSEFYYASPKESGLPGGGHETPTQRERGLAYRRYVEQAAATGYVIGIEWFTLVDQAATGRFFERYNGESANTGLLSVADRPYRAMLEEMMKTNYDIYQVLFGEKPPFGAQQP